LQGELSAEVKEQSQIEEMRAAVRGDIERARGRVNESLRTALASEPAPPADPPQKKRRFAAVFRRG
jgi:hypothetical protein